MLRIVFLMSLCLAARAEDVKVFSVKYADVKQLANIFSAFPVSINADRELKVLAVRGPSEILAAIDESIKRLDVPPAPAKNIQLTVYLLVAGPQAASKGSVPAELEPVVKQLKGIFNYQSFRLLETLLMRDRENQAGEVSGTLPSSINDVNQFSPYHFDISSATVTEDGKDRVIRINNLKLNLKVPVKSGSGFTYRDAGMRTNIDVREGQKVVVGKSNIDSSDLAMVLVLTAKVLE